MLALVCSVSCVGESREGKGSLPNRLTAQAALESWTTAQSVPAKKPLKMMLFTGNTKGSH